MAVVAQKGLICTNADSIPVVYTPVTFQDARKRSQCFTFEIANGDSVGSTYRMFRVRSNHRISAITVYSDAITGAAINVGLYETSANGGAVVLATAYASAVSIAAANTTGTNVAFQTRDIANIFNRVFQDAALAKDPGKTYDIVATLTAAATAGGTLTVSLELEID